MSWPPDVPDVNLSKPHELARLENLETHIREAMTMQEIDTHIEHIAQRFAEEYHQKQAKTFEGCLEMVSLALALSGGALGGKLGLEMLGKSSGAAESACRIVFDRPVD